MELCTEIPLFSAPQILESSLQSKSRNDLFFAGQITGVEGYTESIAAGLLAGINMTRFIKEKELIKLPSQTMLGALCNYITCQEHKKFQPINSNWGILDTLSANNGEKNHKKMDKKLRNELLAQRSTDYLKNFLVCLN